MTEAAGLRLIPITEVFPKEEHISVLLERVRSEIPDRDYLVGTDVEPDKNAVRSHALYIAVPAGMVVCATHQMSTTKTDLIVQDEFKVHVDSLCPIRATVDFPAGHPDIEFLALTSKDAIRLLENAHADIYQFQYGLRLHKKHMLPLLFTRAAHLPKPLYLRQTATVGRRVEGLLGQHVFEHPKETIRVDLGDLYVDDRIISELLPSSTVPNTLSIHSLLRPLPGGDVPEHDPHELKGRAPGMYALYQAARLYFSKPLAEGEKWSDRRKFATDYLQHPVNKLFNLTRTPQVVKLLDPTYRPGRGKQGKSVGFNPSVLKLTEVKAYTREDFVTPPFAILLYATERWIRSFDPKSKGSYSKTKVDLESSLKDYGFDGVDHVLAISDVITWLEPLILTKNPHNQ